MAVKIFKAVWFFSLLAAVAILLYAYAGFPEVIQVREGAEGAGETLSRNELFYAALGLLAIFNVTVFVVNRFMADGDQFFQAWFYGLIICFNLFMVVALQFFNLYNSQEKFDYDSIGYIIYGSVSLIVVWATLYPVRAIIQRFVPKQHIAGN